MRHYVKRQRLDAAILDSIQTPPHTKKLSAATAAQFQDNDNMPVVTDSDAGQLPISNGDEIALENVSS